MYNFGSHSSPYKRILFTFIRMAIKLIETVCFTVAFILQTAANAAFQLLMAPSPGEETMNKYLIKFSVSLISLLPHIKQLHWPLLLMVNSFTFFVIKSQLRS